jgi:hypothetical protein
VDQGRRQGTEVHDALLIRPSSSSRQLERITVSFRSMVRRPQPSRAAISSLE